MLMMAMMTVMVAMMRVMFFDDDGHDEHPWHHHLWAGGESPVPAWLQAPGEGMNSLPRG